MPRSVNELRQESELRRTELANTVGRLKEQIADTAEGIGHKVSPQHIGSEVASFVSDKARSWVDEFKQQAMDNPMRAVGIGAAVSVPLLRLVRGMPLPLLMMGAGLALTSRSVRDRTAEASARTIDGAAQMIEEIKSAAQSLQSGATDQLSATSGGVSDKAKEFRPQPPI